MFCCIVYSKALPESIIHFSSATLLQFQQMKTIILSILFPALTGAIFPSQYGIAAREATDPNTTTVKVMLSGKITDAVTGAPLPGATVYIADDKLGTSAGADGTYRISNIPPGHHIIEISHTGYSTRVEHIELIADTKMDFTLSPVITDPSLR